MEEIRERIRRAVADHLARHPDPVTRFIHETERTMTAVPDTTTPETAASAPAGDALFRDHLIQEYSRLRRRAKTLGSNLQAIWPTIDLEQLHGMLAIAHAKLSGLEARRPTDGHQEP